MSKREWKPGCPDWEEEPDSPRARTQYMQVLARIIDKDHKKLPGTKMVRDGHKEMFEGLSPHPDYLGNFRNLDKAPNCVQNLNVHVDGIYGRSPDTVIDDVNKLVSEFRVRIKDLDAMWRMFKDVKTVFAIDRIAKLAAWAHGEWVWIHPFANGNGRTARLWVNYVLLRFGLPPIAVRPRPSSPYGLAAVASMKDRDHGLMESVILQLLYEGYQDKIRDYSGFL